MKRRRGPPTTPLEIANHLAEVMARRYMGAFDGKIEPDELRGFAKVGAAEALKHWDGRGQFERFAVQRIRWAILRGARRWLLRQPAPASHSAQHALVAAERTADSVDETPDELTMAPRDLADQSAWGYRMELSLADEEVMNLADPAQDPERASQRLQVRRAIEKLPPPEDVVMQRYCYEGESFQEISEALGMGKSTVADAYHRGERRLREQLDPRPPAPPARPPPPPVPLVRGRAPVPA